LEPEEVSRGAVLRIETAGEVGLNWSAGLWCDVQAFRAAMPLSALSERSAPDAVALARLRQATELYRGDFMESFYEDWVVLERATLQEAQAHALELLMRAAERAGDWDTALDYGRRILGDDPLRESIHRRMIALYMQRGDRSQALRQFDDCARALKAELAIEPMPETRVLRHRILAGTFDVPDQPDRLAEELKAAILRVEDALSGLEDARARYVACAGLDVAHAKPTS
jgi:DNA-binding SARP family transcriptional activator